MVSKTSETKPTSSLASTAPKSSPTSSSKSAKEQNKDHKKDKMAATSRANKRQHSSTKKQAESYNISEEKLHEYKVSLNS